MKIAKHVRELLDAGVISEQTATDIRKYYSEKEAARSGRLFVVFGILGAVLIGLGIVLIVAHNWDMLSIAVKTTLAFVPLIAGQLFCGYAVWKNRDSQAWNESAAAFLFFAVGISIALISQVYHISGSLGSFMLTWMMLCLPLIYVMRSSMVSLLYLLGITFYGCETGYFQDPPSETRLYWLLLLAVLPHYYMLYVRTPSGNFLNFHHWFIAHSVTIVLGTVAKEYSELLFVAYFSLFGMYYLIGNLDHFDGRALFNNAYRFLGALGTLVLLLILSFDWFWKDLSGDSFSLNQAILSTEILVSILLSAGAGWLLVRAVKQNSTQYIVPIGPVFLAFIVLFWIGTTTPAVVVFINLLVLGIGISYLIKGMRMDHLGLLNLGLLVISALVACRFFDTNITFILRGVLFLLVGAGFFAANYWMLKQRNK